jgi:PAS domain S-box-containing protein
MNISLLDILDALPVGCVVLDPHRRVRTLNAAMESILGYARDEVAGLPCRHVLRSRRCIQNCPHIPDGAPGPGGRTDCLSRHRRIIPINLTPVRLVSDQGTVLLDIVEDLSQIQALEARLNHASTEESLIGRSPAMERILRLVPIVANHDAPVLISGETGTGKGRLAYAIHKASARSRGPFVRFSCGPMAEALVEVELFGKSGATTQPGRFHQAQGGTLYLAEIESLPPAIQTRLLHFLDEGTIQPQGGHPMRVDVRLMASTMADPATLTAAGRLCENFFHRLAAVRLELPPLRERPEDLAFLLHYFREHFAQRLKKSISGITPKVLDILHAHPFPGNVRELKNIVEFAVLVCPEGDIQPEHLPGYLRRPAPRRGRKE